MSDTAPSYTLTDTIGDTGSITVNADVTTADLDAWFLPGAAADDPNWSLVRLNIDRLARSFGARKPSWDEQAAVALGIEVAFAHEPVDLDDPRKGEATGQHLHAQGIRSFLPDRIGGGGVIPPGVTHLIDPTSDFKDGRGITPVLREAADCVCVENCAEHPPTACSLSGIPHVHPDDGSGTFGPCPVHPDAPGDR